MAKLIRIENAITYNWAAAVRGMRRSWNSHAKQDSYVIEGRRFVMGPNDHKLALKLSENGNSHAKYLRAIIVSFDLIAPGQFWREFDTYKVGTTRLSASQMHTLGKRFLTITFLYESTVTLNYQVLKHIYHDRRNHRLQEWREFCEWIETLPYAELITLGPSKPGDVLAIA